MFDITFISIPSPSLKCCYKPSHFTYPFPRSWCATSLVNYPQLSLNIELSLKYVTGKFAKIYR